MKHVDSLNLDIAGPEIGQRHVGRGHHQIADRRAALSRLS